MSERVTKPLLCFPECLWNRLNQLNGNHFGLKLLVDVDNVERVVGVHAGVEVSPTMALAEAFVSLL